MLPCCICKMKADIHIFVDVCFHFTGAYGIVWDCCFFGPSHCSAMRGAGRGGISRRRPRPADRLPGASSYMILALLYPVFLCVKIILNFHGTARPHSVSQSKNQVCWGYLGVQNRRATFSYALQPTRQTAAPQCFPDLFGTEIQKPEGRSAAAFVECSSS